MITANFAGGCPRLSLGPGPIAVNRLCPSWTLADPRDAANEHGHRAVLWPGNAPDQPLWVPLAAEASPWSPRSSHTRKDERWGCRGTVERPVDCCAFRPVRFASATFHPPASLRRPRF